jgi:hypothetical protein
MKQCCGATNGGQGAALGTVQHVAFSQSCSALLTHAGNNGGGSGFTYSPRTWTSFHAMHRPDTKESLPADQVKRLHARTTHSAYHDAADR